MVIGFQIDGSRFDARRGITDCTECGESHEGSAIVDTIRCFNPGHCTSFLIGSPMPRTQRNDNFIDKSFTVMADMILKMLPTQKRAKEAFVYYRDGMSAQADGEYAEAMQNYEEALTLEDDPYDRSFILYNMGLIHASNGEHDVALKLYHEAIENNPRMPQALNNIAVIHHYLGEQAEEAGDKDAANEQYDQAAEHWERAIRLAPNNYIEAQNWLKTTGRSKLDVFF